MLMENFMVDHAVLNFFHIKNKNKLIGLIRKVKPLRLIFQILIQNQANVFVASSAW